MATLSLQALTRRFGATVAVKAMSLDVADGEFVCLLGPSGCGKSTALRCIAGFEEPDGGDILIDGVSTVAVPPMIGTAPPFTRIPPVPFWLVTMELLPLSPVSVSRFEPGRNDVVIAMTLIL